MLTRFTSTTCPACGRSAKPTPKQPGNETVHGVLNAVPFAGTAYSAYRLSGAKLFCPHCGHQYTASLQEKARAALDQARAFTSGSIAEEREACARIADSLIGADADGDIAKLIAAAFARVPSDLCRTSVQPRGLGGPTAA